MTMSGANYTKNFTNIGKHIDMYNQITAWQTAVRIVEEEAAVILNDDAEETEALKNFLIITRNMATGLDNYKSQLANAVKDYIGKTLRQDIGYTGSAIDLTEILEGLAEDMVEESQSCDASAVAVANGPTYDTDNAGTGSLSAPTSLSQLITTEYFELECTEDDTVGSEVFEVRGEPDHHGTLPDALVSAVAYSPTDENDQPLFTTTLTPYTAGTGYEIAGDNDDELSNYSFTGAAKGSNTDVNGDVYCVLDLITAAEANDGDNQISDWTNITGLSLFVNTDTDGKLYVSIVANAGVEANDNNNQLSNWDDITGVVPSTNTDASGIIHAKIEDDGGGFYHLDLYMDAGFGAGDLVGHTANYNGAGAQAIVADNASGLGGTITIDAVVAVDADITCTYTWLVNLYNDSGKAAGDLVGHTANYSATGAPAITADNASGLGGTLTIDAVTSLDTDITYTVGFYRVKVYKEVGLSNLVAQGGVVGNGTAALVAMNASGLTGSVVIAYTNGEASVQVRIGFAFAVGDKIYFDTSNDEAGTFSEFFRKELGVAPTVDAVGGETIADSLAE